MRQAERYKRYLGRGLRLLLVVALAAASLASGRNVEAGGNETIPATSRVRVTASVLPRATMKILHQAQVIVVTDTDIRRGYLDHGASSVIEVKNNSRSGWLLIFEGLRQPFIKACVQLAGKEVEVGTGSSWVPLPHKGRVETVELSYRFILSEDTRPGTYDWPLLLSVNPY